MRKLGYLLLFIFVLGCKQHSNEEVLFNRAIDHYEKKSYDLIFRIENSIQEDGNKDYDVKELVELTKMVNQLDSLYKQVKTNSITIDSGKTSLPHLVESNEKGKSLKIKFKELPLHTKLDLLFFIKKIKFRIIQEYSYYVGSSDLKFDRIYPILFWERDTVNEHVALEGTLVLSATGTYDSRKEILVDGKWKNFRSGTIVKPEVTFVVMRELSHFYNATPQYEFDTIWFNREKWKCP